MIYQIGSNIISPLGTTTAANYAAAKAGKSALRHYEHGFDLPESFFASIIDDAVIDAEFASQNADNQHFTKFEKLMICSAQKAIQEANINPNGDDVIFILSTTKGNIDLLENPQDFGTERLHLWHSAQLLAQFFGNKNQPIVVSNACISGAAAQISALRLLESGRYQFAVVVGCDVLSKFVISGFQSFKALSPALCQPFDGARCGLNLGEAAATIVYARALTEKVPPRAVALKAGSIANDANHISGPSRTGLGLTHAILQVLPENATETLAFVNAHGTATRYNDDMESVALTNCHLQNVPTNSLKGYFGHTLGAAGVLETILSAEALLDGNILKTNGLEARGTVNDINATTENLSTEKTQCLKLLSGFGGTNAALLLEKLPIYNIVSFCKIDDEKVVANGETLLRNDSADATAWLSTIYRTLGIDYPKFFKMDRLSKAGFLAAELALKNRFSVSETVRTDTAIVLCNRSASLDDDLHYQRTIAADSFFPSPAVFVYTLANIVASEIAIRHKIGGETAFYVMENVDAHQIRTLTMHAFGGNNVARVLTGWVEYIEGKCDVLLMLVERDARDSQIFSEKEINKLLKY